MDIHDSSGPLGPIANEIRDMTYEAGRTNNGGLWIRSNTKQFKYQDGQIFTMDNGCLIEIDIRKCKTIVRKAVKKLTKLSKASSYASKIIHTLVNSDNKFIISIVHITESYTTFPLPNGRLGFINNNAYAFQIIEQGELLVQYAPFNQIGSGAEIRWCPRLGSITLAHELSHAYDANFGLVNDQLLPAYGEVMSAREIRALYHENIIRKQLKMPLKTKANTGSALLINETPFTYPLPTCARY